MLLPAPEAATHSLGRSKAGWARKPAPFSPAGYVFERTALKPAIRHAAMPLRQLLALFG
jgi:hypothetical protein